MPDVISPDPGRDNRALPRQEDESVHVRILRLDADLDVMSSDSISATDKNNKTRSQRGETETAASGMQKPRMSESAAPANWPLIRSR